MSTQRKSRKSNANKEVSTVAGSVAETENTQDVAQAQEVTEMSIPESNVDKIAIKEVSERLGVTEEFIRFSLQETYPDTFDSLKEITIPEFEAIAKSLQSKVLPSSEQSDNPDDEGAIATTPNTPIQQQQKIDVGVGNALTQFVGEFAVNTDRIASALAYCLANKFANNFVEIHSNTFRGRLEDYLEGFADEFSTAAHLMAVTDPKDFLNQQGVLPKERKAIDAIAEILNLANR